MQLWKAHVGAGIDTRQLYIDGERATRAESNPASTLENPVYPEAFRPTVDDIPGLSGIQYIVSDKNPGNWRDPTTWTNVGDIEAVIYDQWKMMSAPLQSVLAPSPDIPSLIGEISSTPVGMIQMNDQASAWTNANLYRSLPTGNETAGQQWIYLNGDFATNGIRPGMTVTGDNILPGTTVDYLVPELNVVALSQAPTATATNVSLTFADPSTGEPVVEHAGIWSFWRVTKFVNTFQFLDQANEWYLDRSTGDLYLVGGPGFNPNSHDIQLPVLEQLLVGNGAANLTFDGLSFKYATWLAPNSAQGYVSDQSGALVVGGGHENNLIGHVKDVERTPGNISFANASNITFTDGHFSHLGGVGVDFLPGAQNNRIANSIFEDISSAAIQFGGVSAENARPGSDPGHAQQRHRRQCHQERRCGVRRRRRDLHRLRPEHQHRGQLHLRRAVGRHRHGLGVGTSMDQGGFAGLPGADPGMWGGTTPRRRSCGATASSGTTSPASSTRCGTAARSTRPASRERASRTVPTSSYNYFYGKHPSGGGNVIYTDGGTRFVTVEGNILLGNPQGAMNFGAPFSFDDPLNNLLVNSFAIMPLVNGTAYGGEIGGCVTYGDIAYIDNLWQDLWTTNPFSRWNFNPTDWPNNPLFYDPAPQHWTPSLSFLANRILDSSLFDNLLVFTRPSAASVARVNSLDGAVSFGIQSMRDGGIQMLLQNAEGSDTNALPFGMSSDAAWLASEGKALGSIASVSGSLQAGVWLPTATLDGNALALTSVQLRQQPARYLRGRLPGRLRARRRARS